MWDWSSFVSGLAGAVLGGAVLFAMLGVARRRTHRRRRYDAVAMIDSELQTLTQSMLADEIAREAEMTPATRLQLTRLANCIFSLRGFERGRAHHVSTWASRRLDALLTSPDPAERPALATLISDALGRWESGERDWRWFRDDPGQHEGMQNAPDQWNDDVEERLRRR